MTFRVRIIQMETNFFENLTGFLGIIENTKVIVIFKLIYQTMVFVKRLKFVILGASKMTSPEVAPQPGACML